MALAPWKPESLINVVVGRELALREEGVDESNALRAAFTGALLAEGALGVVLARQLALRDATVVPPRPTPRPTRPPTDAVDTALEDSLRGFRESHRDIQAANGKIDSLEKQEADIATEIGAAKTERTELCKVQRDHAKWLLEQISSECNSEWTLDVFDEIAKSKNLDLRDICDTEGQDNSGPQNNVDDGNNNDEVCDA